MTDAAFLDAILSAGGGRTAAMLAYADWLRENPKGRPACVVSSPDLAFAWEWAARRGRYPKLARRGAVLWCREPRTAAAVKPWHLPAPVYAQLVARRFAPRGRADGPAFRLGLAVRILAYSLKQCRDAVDLRRPL